MLAPRASTDTARSLFGQITSPSRESPAGHVVDDPLWVRLEVNHADRLRVAIRGSAVAIIDSQRELAVGCHRDIVRENPGRQFALVLADLLAVDRNATSDCSQVFFILVIALPIVQGWTVAHAARVLGFGRHR
jgi:hypothetical protein